MMVVALRRARRLRRRAAGSTGDRGSRAGRRSSARSRECRGSPRVRPRRAARGDSGLRSSATSSNGRSRSRRRPMHAGPHDDRRDPAPVRVATTTITGRRVVAPRFVPRDDEASIAVPRRGRRQRRVQTADERVGHGTRSAIVSCSRSRPARACRGRCRESPSRMSGAARRARPSRTRRTAPCARTTQHCARCPRRTGTGRAAARTRRTRRSSGHAPGKTLRVELPADPGILQLLREVRPAERAVSAVLLHPLRRTARERRSNSAATDGRRRSSG